MKTRHRRILPPLKPRSGHSSRLVPMRLRGVSMVEVLVATVVLSIGLLGLAGLQASGLRVGQSSIHRSQAAQLAYDMAERIRVNFGQAELYNLALSAPPPTCAAAPTTSDEVAQCDLRDWRLRLQALPGGQGSVAVNGTAVTIVVQWDDTRGAGVLRGTDKDDSELAKLQATQFVLTADLAN